MKKITLVLMVVFLSGCVSARFPQYLSDEYPYKNKYFAGFEEARMASRQALEELGWTISGESDPLIYEQNALSGENDKQIIIFTEIRQTPLVVGTRYAKVNILVRAVSNGSEVEVRYLTITSLPFRSLESYRNDSAAQRVLKYISDLLEE